MASSRHSQGSLGVWARPKRLSWYAAPSVIHHLPNQGVPLAEVQSILSHEKPETIQLYAVLSGEAPH